MGGLNRRFVAGWRRSEGLATVHSGNAPDIIMVIEALW
jgi:hypothetical protein